MSGADAFLRGVGRRQRPLRGERRETEETKPAPLISQGARSGSYPRPLPSPDDLLRSFRRSRSFGPGGWERIA
jgi:hypothetical protein